MSFWTELKRRNVVKVAAAYAAMAWLLSQIADVVLTTFEAPSSVGKIFLILLPIGFVLATVFAWFYELTAAGIRPTTQVVHGQSITRQTGRRLDRVIIAVLALAIVLLVVDNYLLTDEAEASIAVLPFDSLSADADNERLADGFTVEIQNSLTQVPDLRVVALTSSTAYRDSTLSAERIAAELGVDYLLEGDVNRVGDDVRIVARLIRASNGSNVWSTPYDRTLDDLLALQIEIAGAVAERLSATFGIGDFDRRVGGTDKLAAYEHYLLARGYAELGLNERVDIQAENEYRQALALDPDFGLAQLGLGRVLFNRMRSTGLTFQSDSLPPEVVGTMVSDAKAAIERAALLVPDNPALTLIEVQNDIDSRNWSQAASKLSQHLNRTGLSDFYGDTMLGNLLMLTGRIRAALPYLERARGLDPRRAGPLTQLAMAYDALGDSERAYALFEESRALAGFDTLSIMPQYWRIMATGDFDGAKAFLDGEPANSNMIHEQIVMAPIDDLKGALTDPTLSQLALITSNIGLAAAARGETDVALQAWRLTLPNAPSFLVFSWTPLMADVRRHPDFELLLRDMGLVAYWNESVWPDFCQPIEPEGFACH